MFVPDEGFSFEVDYRKANKLSIERVIIEIVFGLKNLIKGVKIVENSDVYFGG